MRVGAFIKDKLSYIITVLCVFSYIIGNLRLFRYSSYIVYLCIVGMCVILVVPMTIEYIRKYRFYKAMELCIDSLEKKYVLCELLKRPSFSEGAIVYDGIEQINRNMMDEIMRYKQNMKEYKEYVDLWVHEIKTPVTNIKLLTENHPNQITNSIEEEVEKMEGYIEQTLYYSKANLVEKDYVISKVTLYEVVTKAVKQNKKALIGHHIRMDLHDLEITVQTDAKWMTFILNQIITNCVKYKKKQNSYIEIYGKKTEQNVQLCIKDNGIGIKNEEILKVLQKGFVGSNGRKKEASTGMGLYICDKLLTKMNHGIYAESEEGAGTNIIITFPVTDFYFDY